MSQEEFFPTPTTILRMPSWLGSDVTEESELPLTPGDYKVTPGTASERWTVTSLKTNETVYSGIGPVEISRYHPVATLPPPSQNNDSMTCVPPFTTR